MRPTTKKLGRRQIQTTKKKEADDKKKRGRRQNPPAAQSGDKIRSGDDKMLPEHVRQKLRKRSFHCKFTGNVDRGANLSHGLVGRFVVARSARLEGSRPRWDSMRALIPSRARAHGARRAWRALEMRARRCHRARLRCGRRARRARARAGQTRARTSFRPRACEAARDEPRAREGGGHARALADAFARLWHLAEPARAEDARARPSLGARARADRAARAARSGGRRVPIWMDTPLVGSQWIWIHPMWDPYKDGYTSVSR